MIFSCSHRQSHISLKSDGEFEVPKYDFGAFIQQIIYTLCTECHQKCFQDDFLVQISLPMNLGVENYESLRHYGIYSTILSLETVRPYC